MLIDFSPELKTLDGQPLKEGPDKEAKPLSLKLVCQNALLGVYQNDDANGEEKSQRWLLAMRLEVTPVTEVTPEEVTRMKKLIGLAYGPLVVGQSYKMLNG